MKGDSGAFGSFIIIVVAVLAVKSCHGFSTTALPHRNPTMAPKAASSASKGIVAADFRRSYLHITVLQVSSHDDINGNRDNNNKKKKLSRDAIIARNNARCCCKQFLTQRAIQSFMFLMAECRDPHSGKWIEDFLGLQNLSQYHGTGAFDIDRFPSWEMVLLEMMKQPKGAYSTPKEGIMRSCFE